MSEISELKSEIVILLAYSWAWSARQSKNRLIFFSPDQPLRVAILVKFAIKTSNFTPSGLPEKDGSFIAGDLDLDLDWDVRLDLDRFLPSSEMSIMPERL